MKFSRRKKYLISGIAPGESGVGRLLFKLIPEYKENGYEIIFPYKKKPIKDSLLEFQVVEILKEFFLRIISRIKFQIKIFKVVNSEVIGIHPQTIGFFNFGYLIRKNNFSFYVMDNSFFCIRSYNFHPREKKECFQCLLKFNPDSLCKPFPVRYSIYRNKKFLQLLTKYSHKISFLAQNKFQKELLKKHYGHDIKTSIVGMDTGEVVRENAEDRNIPNKKGGFDVVFHGAPLLAKGLEFCVQLAEKLPEYSFLIPSSIKEIEDEIGRPLFSSNIVCKSLSWETGLKDEVIKAKIVLNPSLWSAPIEGALLKSSGYNKNVATVKTEFGYEAEIRSIKNHLRLSSDVEIAAKELQEFMLLYG